MSISLDQQDWLKSFIDLVLQQYDVELAQANAAQLPEENRGEAAVTASLARRGATFGFPSLHPEISENQEFASIKFLSTLKHQAEIVLDVAVALNRPIQDIYGHFALVMLWWASLGELDHAEALANAWREISTGERSIEEYASSLEEQYVPLGDALKSNAILKDDPILALPVNQGISYFAIRFMGLLGLALHDDERLERHEIERYYTETHSDRIHCVEATIALAWSNGLLEAEERNLIKKQLEMLRLNKKEKRKLLNLMITPSTPKEFAQSFSSPETAMFVLRQLVIASLIDGVQDNRERKFLHQSSKAFGLAEEQYQAIQTEMKNFIEENKSSIEQMKRHRKKRPSLL
jgi:uncharacterized membrane protein YebE (DUF533 family)